MINSRVELLFKNLPDKYPQHLEKNHLRILNRLMLLWNTPEFDSYIIDLMIIKRGSRQGFSTKVIAELMFLNELHDIFKSKKYHLPEITDSWKKIPVPNPTPQGLHQAIELGKLDVVEAFLRAGVKVDYRFDDTQTLLMVAVISGQPEAARFLIDYGADVNLSDSGKYTALHWAAYYGRSQIIEALIDADAEIDATQNSGATPLALAVTRERMDVARLLLKHQANPSIVSNLEPSFFIASGKSSLANESSNSKTDSPRNWDNVAPEKIDSLNKPTTGEKQIGAEAKPPLFLYIPSARLVLMSIATFGLYQPYWFYQNWRHIKERYGLNINPLWRACLGIFFCHSLLQKIHQDRKARSAQILPAFFSNWLASGWVMLLIILAAIILYQRNAPGILLIFGYLILPPLCLVPVQNYINAVTEKMNPRQQYYGWPWGRIDALIFSAFLIISSIGLSIFKSHQKQTAITQNQADESNLAVSAQSAVAPPLLPEPELPQVNQPAKHHKKHVSRIEPKTRPAVNPVAAYTFDDLINAVWHSDTKSVDHLLELGMDINRRDGSGLTPLIVAVENNDLNMVKHLLAKGADPNIPRQRDGFTPIVIAKTTSKPNAELIEFLKSSGASNPFDQSVNPIRH